MARKAVFGKRKKKKATVSIRCSCGVTSDDGAEGVRWIRCDRCRLADGTFSICPREFSQVLVLGCYVNNNFTDAATILLNGKTMALYSKVFTLLSECDPLLSPEYLITDFEIGIGQAFLDVFPSVSLKKCHSHFVRSVCAKARSCGLSFTDPQHLQLHRRMCALPLLDPVDLRLAFEEVRSAHSGEFTDFMKYMFDTYVGGAVGSRYVNPRFSLDETSIRDVYIQYGVRSTNAVEGINLELAVAFLGHPALRTFLSNLQRRENAQHTLALVQLVQQLPAKKARSRIALRHLTLQAILNARDPATPIVPHLDVLCDYVAVRQHH